MTDSLQIMGRQLKDNISLMISKGLLCEAQSLIDQYKNIVKDDTEVMSMQAVIAISQNQLETAENILLQGLAINPNDFDLLYNLAYVAEKQDRYCQAKIYYKQARRQVLYDIEKKNTVDNAIEELYKNNKVGMDKEKANNIVYRQLDTIQSVLFIDFDVNMETNKLAKILYDYGIDVDLVYTGINPCFKFKAEDLSYRKIIAFDNQNSLKDYLASYPYSIIHVFPSAHRIENDIKKLPVTVICFAEVIDVKAILNEYSSVVNRKKKFIKNLSSVNCNFKENITIVIPTYNRTKYLNRILKFFNQYNNKGINIVVLDSSCSDIKQMNKTICDNFKNILIHYFEFDSSIDPWIKTNFGIQQVKTPYVCLCADDDFIVEEGIARSIEVLTNRKDLFSVKGKNLFYIKTMANLQEYDFCTAFDEDEPVLRLEKLVTGFVPSLIYQVFRINEFRNLYGFWVENKEKLPPNAVFQEYLFYFMVVLTGKIGKVNLDFNIRDKGVPRETEIKNFPHTLMEGTFNVNYKLFKKFLLSYGENINMNSQQLPAIMEEVFSSFLINFLRIPQEYVVQNEGSFDLEKLGIGMRKSWVWPRVIS